jgi:hypothetical protein
MGENVAETDALTKSITAFFVEPLNRTLSNFIAKYTVDGYRHEIRGHSVSRNGRSLVRPDSVKTRDQW